MQSTAAALQGRGQGAASPNPPHWQVDGDTKFAKAWLAMHFMPNLLHFDYRFRELSSHAPCGNQIGRTLLIIVRCADIGCGIASLCYSLKNQHLLCCSSLNSTRRPSMSTGSDQAALAGSPSCFYNTGPTA